MTSKKIKFSSLPLSACKNKQTNKQKNNKTPDEIKRKELRARFIDRCLIGS